MKYFILVPLLLSLVACSHISISDARWISQHAEHIDEVHDRLGSPEHLSWEGETEVARYIDTGRHTSWLGYIPVVNIVAFPILLVDYFVGSHNRQIVVRYDSVTGRVISVDDTLKVEVK